MITNFCLNRIWDANCFCTNRYRFYVCRTLALVEIPKDSVTVMDKMARRFCMQNLYVKEYLMRPWIFCISSWKETGVEHFRELLRRKSWVRCWAKADGKWGKEESVLGISLVYFSLYFHQHWIFGLWHVFICDFVPEQWRAIFFYIFMKWKLAHMVLPVIYIEISFHVRDRWLWTKLFRMRENFHKFIIKHKWNWLM